MNDCEGDWCGKDNRVCAECLKPSKCGKDWCSPRRRCVDCQQIKRAQDASEGIDVPPGLTTLEKTSAAFLLMCQQYEQLGNQLACVAEGLNILRMEAGLKSC